MRKGADTSDFAFENYKSLQLGIDGRMYIGKVGGGFKQFSVIDYPDLKGAACGFCRKCFRVDNALGGLNTPPNVPDFNLGADLSMLPCAPLAIHQFGNLEMSQLEIYPNPSSSIFYIKNRKGKKKVMFNSVGQMVFDTTKEAIEVSRLSKGVYYIKVEGEIKKVVVE